MNIKKKFFSFQLTRNEFDKRIRELNEASNKSRLNRFVTFLPLYIILVAIAIVLPLIFTRQVSNVSNNFNFEDFKKDTRASFTTWAWTIMGIFIGFILALVLTSCLNHKSRINQFRAHTKKLNELNVIDNPKGINWKIDTDTGYINAPRSTYNSYRNSRELCNQKVYRNFFFKFFFLIFNTIQC